MLTRRSLWLSLWLCSLAIPGAQLVLAQATPRSRSGATAEQAPTATRKKTAAPAESPEARQRRRDEVIASFDGGNITVGQLEDTIAASATFREDDEGRGLDPAAVAGMLDRSLRFELLAAEAARRGYDQKPRVAHDVKQNAVQVMLKREVDDAITPQSISDEAVKKYYEQHVDEFVRPEMRRASQIVLGSEADAQALLAQARASDMRAFRELARNRSLDDTTKLRGGDLGYFDAQGKPQEPGARIEPKAASATFALKELGDTSDVVRTDAGFAIFKLMGLRRAHEQTPKDADDTIRTRLWRQEREASIDRMVSELKAELKPTTHPELIDAIRFDDADPMPPVQGAPQGFPITKPAASTPKAE